MLPGVFGSIPCLQSFCKQVRNTLVYQSIFGPVFMRNSNAGDCSLTSGHTGTSVGGSSKVNGTLVRFSATILSQNKGEIVLPLIIPTTSRPTSIEVARSLGRVQGGCRVRKLKIFWLNHSINILIYFHQIMVGNTAQSP